MLNPKQKHKPNWLEIKKRYLAGEKPKDIAPAYGLTANQVSEKARREKWKPKKTKINQKVEESVAEDTCIIKTKAQKLISAVFNALILDDGTLDKESIKNIPPGIVSACLSKALPEGIVDEKSKNNRIEVFMMRPVKGNEVDNEVNDYESDY